MPSSSLKNLTKCFKATHKESHIANLDNQPWVGKDWRNYWLEVPCCSSRLLSPKPCCTSNCLSSTHALWAPNTDPSLTLEQMWRPSRTFKCGDTAIVPNINYPWKFGFEAMSCPRTDPNDPKNWVNPHKPVKYFIPYTRKDNTSSSWIMLSPGNSSVSYTPLRFLKWQDTIKIFDASHRSYVTVKNNSSSGFAFKPSMCAVVTAPNIWGQEVFKHRHLGYVGGSVPCLRCLDSTSYSSLPSVRASMCVGPARFPEDFTAKGNRCNVATNANQLITVSHSYPQWPAPNGWSTKSPPPTTIQVYKPQVGCGITGQSTTYPPVMPYMWLNCSVADDGGWTNAVYAHFNWPNVFTHGHKVFMTTNMWCRGEYADMCCNGSLQSLGTASGCCDTDAYVNPPRGCFMDIFGLNNPKVEYEWHWAKDEAHDEQLRASNYPPSAAATWTTAAAPYDKKSDEIDLSVHRLPLNAHVQLPWLNTQRHKIFNWEDGDCLPGKIINLRARIKATCPLTGGQVIQPLWSYNRVMQDGGVVGNIWHKVGNAHLHTGTVHGLMTPYQIGKNWITKGVQVDTTMQVRFSPSCSVDCTSSSGQKGLVVHGTLCSGAYAGSSVKAYLPIGVFPHSGRSYKQWKQEICHKLAFGNNGVPGFKTKVIEVQRTVNGSLRNDCVRINGCEERAPICPPYPPIGAPFNQSFGVIISGPYMGPGPFGDACTTCIALTNCHYCCEPCDNGAWKTKGYDTYGDCARVEGCWANNCYGCENQGTQP